MARQQTCYRDLAAHARQAVHEALEFGAVLLFHLQKLDADAGSGARDHDLAKRPYFLVLNPKGESDLRSLFEGTGHLDEATARADVSDPSPGAIIGAGGMQFNREGTFSPRVLAAFVKSPRAGGIVGSPRWKREVPDDFVGFDILQSGQETEPPQTGRYGSASSAALQVSRHASVAAPRRCAGGNFLQTIGFL